jgi:spore coat protein H
MDQRYPSGPPSAAVFLVFFFAALSCAAGPASNPAPRPAFPKKPAQLFAMTQVWNVHLKFTPDQWAAMEPKTTPPQRSAGLGIAGMVTTPIFRQADLNHDHWVSKEEFGALAGRWFTTWDVDHQDKVNIEQLRVGLNTVVGDIPAFRAGFSLLGPQGGRNGVAAAFGVSFDYVHADLDFEGKTFKDVGVRYKGNGTFFESRRSIKRSLKVELNRFVSGEKLAGIVKLNLHNNVTDAAWMNEVLSHRLYRDAGVPAPRTSYTRVYVTVPGKYDHKYFGLYSIVEDPDKHFAKEKLAGEDGAIFKPVTPTLFSDLGDDWADYKQIYDGKAPLTREQAQRVIDFSRLVTSADDPTFAQKLPEFLDLDEFARYMAVTTYLSTMDSILALGQNFYVYLDPTTNKFQFLPWDLDHSFGHFPMIGTEDQRNRLSIMHPWRGEVRFLERVFKVEAFKQVYLARMREFSQTIFQPQRFHEQVDQIAAAIRPAIGEESADMLARFDRIVTNAPSKPKTNPGFFGNLFGGEREEVKSIKAFVDVRSKSIADQLSGKSQGEVLASGGFGAGGPGAGPRGFGPGNFLSGPMMAAFDANHDNLLTREETLRGFDNWFTAWNIDKTGHLTSNQLRAGLNIAMAPQPPAPTTRPAASTPPPHR